MPIELVKQVILWKIRVFRLFFNKQNPFVKKVQHSSGRNRRADLQSRHNAAVHGMGFQNNL